MTGTLGFVIGLAAIAWGGVTAWDAWWGRASRTWTTVPGTITQSRVEQFHHRDDDGDDTVTEQAKIEYHFEVDNRVFWGGRVAYDGAFGKLSAWQTVDRYPSGATVTVAYDPTDPRRCVLEPGFHRSMTAAFSGAVVLLVVALVLLLV
jgi:hypothetical protein